MTTLYGIPNCDTVKKARRWLEEQGHGFRFHDFRKDGLSIDQIEAWLTQLGADVLVNKRSTTWKQLDENDKALVGTNQTAQLLAANPTLIKRPVLDIEGTVQVGFKADIYQDIFK